MYDEYRGPAHGGRLLLLNVLGHLLSNLGELGEQVGSGCVEWIDTLQARRLLLLLSSEQHIRLLDYVIRCTPAETPHLSPPAETSHL